MTTKMIMAWGTGYGDAKRRAMAMCFSRNRKRIWYFALDEEEKTDVSTSDYRFFGAHLTASTQMKVSDGSVSCSTQVAHEFRDSDARHRRSRSCVPLALTASNHKIDLETFIERNSKSARTKPKHRRTPNRFDSLFLILICCGWCVQCPSKPLKPSKHSAVERQFHSFAQTEYFPPTGMNVYFPSTWYLQRWICPRITSIVEPTHRNNIWLQRSRTHRVVAVLSMRFCRVFFFHSLFYWLLIHAVRTYGYLRSTRVRIRYYCKRKNEERTLTHTHTLNNEKIENIF